MAKILIYKNVEKNGEYDIFNFIDYKKFYNECTNNSCYNVGNRLWLQGIIVALQDGNNEIEFLSPNMNTDYINSEYDYIVLPMANIFNSNYVADMERLTDIFSSINIPTFVIACGVQADSYDCLDDLVSMIKQPASRFIESIYNTGGEFALRGYFTKSFFDKLGFSSAVVTGCPSMYQLGPDFQVTKRNVKTLKTALNGEIGIVKNFLRENNSVYFDQDKYFGLVSATECTNFGDSYYTYLKRLVRQYGFFMLDMAMQHKLLLFLDTPIWRNYLIDQNFNFSFGTRIHGNIMSILCGIPSVVYACDSRTREMSEFFSIPMVSKESKYKNLESLYSFADYKNFNTKYKDNYARFEKFLMDHQLVKMIGTYNSFFSKSTDSKFLDWEFQQLDKYKNVYNKNKLRLFLYDKEVNAYRLIRKK